MTQASVPAARGVLATTLVVTLLIPSNYTLGGVGVVGLPCVLLGVGCLWLWVVGRMHGSTDISRGFGPVHGVLALYLVAALLTTGTGLTRRLNPIESASMGRDLINTVSYLGLALLTLDALRTRHQLERLVRVLVTTVAIVAAIGVVEFFTRVHPFYLQDLPLLQRSEAGVIVRERFNLFRVYSTTQHPIEFGVLLSTVLPLALHQAMRPLRRRGDVVAAGVIAVALPLAVSRSAIVGLVVGLFVVAIGWSWSRRLDALVLMALVVAGLRGVVPGLVGALIGLFSNAEQDPSISGRTDDYAVLGQLFRAAPITGRGFGTYTPELYRVLDNQYLLSLINGGLVLLAGLVLLLLGPWASARGLTRSRHPGTASMGRALMAGVIVTAVCNATFDGLTFRTSSAIFFVLAGLIGALRRIEAEESRLSARERELVTAGA